MSESEIAEPELSTTATNEPQTIGEMGKIALEKNYKQASPEEKGDIELSIANFIINHFHIKTTWDNKIHFYLDKKGIYTPRGENIIKAYISNILNKTNTTHCDREIVHKIINATQVFKTVDELAKKSGDELYDVCLENGVLNVKTGEFKPHSHNEFFITKIHVTYNPEAKCPKIEKFLKEIAKKDYEDPEEKTYWQLVETAGWCLIQNEYYPQSAIALIGIGSNGKSTYIGLIRMFLGERNCTSISLLELEENPFAKGFLFGRLANLYPELTDKTIEHSGIFKQITGGDPVTADVKFGERFSFVNKAKLIFSANKYPRPPTDEDSNAFWRRWVKVSLEQSFTQAKGNENRDILKEMCTPEELSGFLNLALLGAKRLLNERQFILDIGKSIEEKRRDYLLMSDVIPLFLDEAIVQSEGEYITRKDMYLLFKAYVRITKSSIMYENFSQRKLTASILGLISKQRTRYGWIKKAVKTKENIDVWMNVKIADLKGLAEAYDDVSEEALHEEIEREEPIHF